MTRFGNLLTLGAGETEVKVALEHLRGGKAEALEKQKAAQVSGGGRGRKEPGVPRGAPRQGPSSKDCASLLLQQLLQRLLHEAGFCPRGRAWQLVTRHTGPEQLLCTKAAWHGAPGDSWRWLGRPASWLCCLLEWWQLNYQLQPSVLSVRPTAPGRGPASLQRAVFL